jgi:orotate phosphoribosyltransferase
LRNSRPKEEKVYEMKNIENLMKKATELKAEGLVEGQISEELNVSGETVTWLLTHAEKTSTSPGPKDISVDWSAIGRSAFRLNHISEAMTDIIYETLDANESSVDVVVGIALSGLPIASMVANDLAAELAVYIPSKQMIAQENKRAKGNLSSNFSDVQDKDCIIVDDVVTSGQTLEEAVEYLDEHGARINAIAVLIDKKGTEEIAGVPVVSLLKVMRVN